MENTMQIACYSNKGSAQDVLKITAHDIPTCGDNDVLVRLHYSGINPSDVKMRAGLSIGGMEMPFPMVVPHSDGAGIITAVGANVTGLNKGGRVYVFNGGFRRAFGTAAEYICLDQNQVALLPDSVSLSHGACLGIPAMTAVHAITRAPKLDGKTVLISSGGGVVGRYCIEIAKAKGARKIIATARTPLSQQTAMAAGADAVIDYNAPDMAEQIMDLSGGIDHAVEAEFGQNAAVLGQVINVNGSIAAYGSALNKTPQIAFYDFMFKNITIHALLIYLLDSATRKANIAVIHDLLERHAISENIATIMPLKDITAAHELVEAGGKSGSVLLDLS